MADGVRDGQNVQLAHDRLRGAIVGGEMPAGQVTSQAVLAEHFDLGLSRTPLREALRVLQHDGLVLSEPNRRIRIADFSIADLVIRPPYDQHEQRIAIPDLSRVL